MIRNGKKLIEIPNPLALMLVISEMMISLRMLAPVWPMFAKTNPPAYAPKELAEAQRI